MNPVRIGITMGDPAGVGPEIVAKAVSQGGIDKLGKIIIIGDRWVFDKVTNYKLQIPNSKFIDLRNISHKNFKFGKVKGEYGKAAIEYLKQAVNLIKTKKIDCLVTAPISKQAIKLAGYRYNGHTEFLARAFNRPEQDLVMMLFNRYLKISLVTRHLPLNKVGSSLSRKSIYKTIITTYRALGKYFAIKQPVICVAALNPHAGEGGLLGREEAKIILPAIKKAKRIVKKIIGPIPIDTAVSDASQGQFDAVIAMYHDQALIPLKILDFHSGVNITLGLNFVRTSPLHGTAFDIAGKNIASNSSLVSAIKTAVKCTLNLRKTKK